MKYTCQCGKDVDEVEFSQYCNSLSSLEECIFMDSLLCPDCYEMVR